MFVLFLGGCAGLEKHIQTPTVHYAGNHIKNVSLYDASVDFLIHVDNPNPISLPVQGLNYTVDINNKKMLSGSAQPGTQIPAISGIDISLPVVIRYEEFLDGLQQLMHQDSYAYAIKGDIDLGFFKVPYHASGSIPLPKLPQIQLKSISVEKFSFDGIETAMRFSINNANDFPLVANGLSYQLLLNNIATLSGNNTDAINVAAKSDSTFEIISKFSLMELGKVLDTLRKSNSVNATLKGELDVPAADNQTKSIPFSWSGETAIVR
ncbi:MAG: LEA type 2 family protein [Gammaproteobacteria bacterium]|jgi:LEA14-like dessication related protein